MKKYLIAIGIILVIFAGFTIYGNRVENDRKEQEASELLRERNERREQERNTIGKDIELFIPTAPPPDVYGYDGDVIDQGIMIMTPEEVLGDYKEMLAVIGEKAVYSDENDTIEINGVDINKLTEKYMDEINAQIEKNVPDRIFTTVYWFAGLVNRCLTELNAPDKIFYVDSAGYLSHIDMFYEMVISGSGESSVYLFNEKTFNVYKLLNSETAARNPKTIVPEGIVFNPYLWVMLPNSGLLIQCGADIS